MKVMSKIKWFLFYGTPCNYAKTVFMGTSAAIDVVLQ